MQIHPEMVAEILAVDELARESGAGLRISQ